MGKAPRKGILLKSMAQPCNALIKTCAQAKLALAVVSMELEHKPQQLKVINRNKLKFCIFKHSSKSNICIPTSVVITTSVNKETQRAKIFDNEQQIPLYQKYKFKLYIPFLCGLYTRNFCRFFCTVRQILIYHLLSP